MAGTETLPFQGATPVAELDTARIVSKIAWRIMPLIMVCYLFAFFDRINISFAKFSLQADLGLSDTAYGLGAGLFVVGYVLFEVPSNLMLYKVGARRWIAARLACPIRISRTSRAGAPRRATCDAAATRGSFRTTRSSRATRIGRTRRPSRRASLSTACACTGCRGRAS